MTDSTALKQQILQQNGIVIWLTGLSGSGKSTIANGLESKLLCEGRFPIILDGDELRSGINSDLGFSDEDRKENIRRAAGIASILAGNGVIVIASFITPFEDLRSLARNLIGENYLEVYVKASVETCEQRDVKGLYKKARTGELQSFTGIGSKFETPMDSDLILDTEYSDADDSVDRLYRFILPRIIL